MGWEVEKMWENLGEGKTWSDYIVWKKKVSNKKELTRTWTYMCAYHIRYELNVLGRESLVHDTKQMPNQEAAHMLMVKSKKSKQNRNRVGEVICSLPDVRQGWSTAVPSSCGQPAYRIWSISIAASAQEFNTTSAGTALQDLSARAKGCWSPHSFTGYTCAWVKLRATDTGP